MKKRKRDCIPFKELEDAVKKDKDLEAVKRICSSGLEIDDDIIFDYLIISDFEILKCIFHYPQTRNLIWYAKTMEQMILKNELEGVRLLISWFTKNEWFIGDALIFAIQNGNNQSIVDLLSDTPNDIRAVWTYYNYDLTKEEHTHFLALGVRNVKPLPGLVWDHTKVKYFNKRVRDNVWMMLRLFCHKQKLFKDLRKLLVSYYIKSEIAIF